MFFKKILRKLRKENVSELSKQRIEKLREMGCRIGEDTVIYSDDVSIDTQTPWLIEIGNNVKITKGVIILTHGYDWCVLKNLYGDVLGSRGKVTIGNNVFIGMGTTILKNVTIGDNSIIAAGSVVCSGDYPENSIIAGVPAKVIGTLEDYYKKRINAQVREAKELAVEYKKVTNSIPPKAVFREFFWLFEPRVCGGGLPREFLEVQSLGGNLEKSMLRFMQTKPQFNGYEEFIEFCYKADDKKS